MYWIALVLFMSGVVVPEVVRHDIGAFHEEEIELVALVILNGLLFVIYLWTDRARRTVQDAMRAIGQESHDATKDLSRAYSHIGEMNRKMEIVAQFVADVDAHDIAALCDLLRESIERITRNEHCYVYIIDAVHQRLHRASSGAPAVSRQQCRTLLTARTGEDVAVGDSDVTYAHLLYKTTASPRIVVVVDGDFLRVTQDEALMRIVMGVALNAIRRDTGRVNHKQKSDDKTGRTNNGE